MDTKTKKRVARYVLAPTIIFALTFVVYYSQALAGKEDISRHMKYALSFDTTIQVAHCAWHLVCYALYVCLPITIEQAAGASTALYNAFSAVIIMWMVERYFSLNQEKKGGSVCAPTLLTLCALLVGPLYLRFYNASYYTGQGSPNIWHNPTTLATRPFMLLTGILTIFYWEMGRSQERLVIGTLTKRTASNREGDAIFHQITMRKTTALQIALAVTLFCSTLAKPSFFMAYGPACFILEVGRCIRKKGKTFFWHLRRNLYFFPSLFLFLSQYIRIYLFGGVNHTNTTIAIAFFRAAGKYAPSIPISLLLRMAFPFLVIVLWARELIRKTDFQLISLQYVIALLTSWTFTEVGKRQNSGNFGWGNMLCSSYLWIYCLLFFFKQWKQEGFTLKKTRYLIPVLLLLWHLVAGIVSIPEYIY